MTGWAEISGRPGFRRFMRAAGLALLMLAPACEESLPPYRTPSEVFSLALSADQPNLEAVRRDLVDISAGKGGLGFSMDLRNVFDETLADTVREPLGELQIWWRDDPSVTATLPIGRADEVMTHAIQWGGLLVFDPGDSVHFAVAYKTWMDDRGSPLWERVERWQGTGEAELIEYPPMRFSAQARIQPFDRAPAVYSNRIDFTLIFCEKREENEGPGIRRNGRPDPGPDVSVEPPHSSSRRPHETGIR